MEQLDVGSLCAFDVFIQVFARRITRTTQPNNLKQNRAMNVENL